jgi:flagellar basal-body rod modification protein FlgD
MSTIGSNPSTSSQNTTDPTKSQSAKDMDNFIGTRQDFLTILIAQLKHQDPLDPMKGTEFIDSITRLSSVEQAVNQNTHLEKIEELLGAKNSSQLGSPVSYLDKDVEFKSSSINVASGSEAHFSYNLTSANQKVNIAIKTMDGQTVYSGTGSNTLGRNNIKWDGKDSVGSPYPSGEYKVEVSYTQASGVVVPVDTYTSGIVTGADFQGNEAELIVGNLKTPLENITSIKSNGQLSQN